MPIPRMLFGNFITHFDTYVLKDYLQEIVVPAFMDDALVREYGDTSFFFYQPKIVRLGREKIGRREVPILGIRGRFVKNLTLHRSHLYRDRYGLIADDAALESAAFAFFVLILNSHKLLFLPETAYPFFFAMVFYAAVLFLKLKSFLWNLYQTFLLAIVNAPDS